MFSSVKCIVSFCCFQGFLYDTLRHGNLWICTIWVSLKFLYLYIFTNLKIFWLLFKYFCPIFSSLSETPIKCKLDFKICPIAPLDSVYFSFFPSLFFILDNFYILPSSLLTLSKKILYFSGMFHLLLLILFLCWDSFFSFILVLFRFKWLIFDIIIVLKYLFAQIPKSPQE